MEILKYSICLIPDKEGLEKLNKIIESLAHRYQSFTFLPHLTVYKGVVAPFLTVKKTFDKVVSQTKPFTIKAKGLNYSERLSKTFFIEFEMNDSLKKIYSLIKADFISYGNYELDPHISLLYKNNLPVEEKIKITNSVSIPNEITIDRCTIYSATKSIVKEEDIKDWKILEDKRFNL